MRTKFKILSKKPKFSSSQQKSNIIIFFYRDISHRNIVQFFGIFISNQNEKYMVSEFMNGGSLLDILHAQKNNLTKNDLMTM